MGSSVVLNWDRIYYKEGPQTLNKEQRGRKKNLSSKPKKKININENKDLLEKVQRLRMENEYLKNLNVLVQERIKHENKKVIVVDKLRQKYSLKELLKLAEIPRSTFYYHLK